MEYLYSRDRLVELLLASSSTPVMWCGASPTNNGAADILLFWRCSNKFVQNFSYFCSSSTFLLAKDFSFLSDSRRRPKNPEPPARSSKRLAVGTRVEEISKKNLFYHANLLLHTSSGTEHSGLKTGAPHFLARFVPNSFLIGQIQKFGRSRTKFLRLIKNFKSPVSCKCNRVILHEVFGHRLLFFDTA